MSEGKKIKSEDIDILKAVSTERENMKSTEEGFINKNNQRNKGRSSMPGTDNLQWFYFMECLKCGYEYYANGTNIKERKCPKCQGGKE